jgi:hypothetical protein
LENHVEELNEWVFEVDNERKAAEVNERRAEKKYIQAKNSAYGRLHKLRKEIESRKAKEAELDSMKTALCQTKHELEVAKALLDSFHETRCRMKKEWDENVADAKRTKGGSRHWPTWAVLMICELLIDGTAPTAVPTNIQTIYETLYNEQPEELSLVNFVRECRVVVEVMCETTAAINITSSSEWGLLWTDATTRRQIPFTALIVGLLGNNGNLDPVVISSCIFMEDQRSQSQADRIVKKVNALCV